uniref:DNA-directed RNA polymerase n=1 Tax=Wolfiporia cocos TaxID=81056 RepID=A0A7G7YDQ6_9APHY|nr:hypothetical protein [Wolfiporia cocos]QNH92626.1 hypothetical protein [Wolfiporia cocos]
MQDKTKFIQEIAKSKEPWQYLAAFFALYNYKQDPTTIIHLPILYLASCSGLQHLSAITKEVSLAKNTNVIALSDNPREDKPADFYSLVLNRTNLNLSIDKNENLRNIKLDRAAIKRSVMTVPYYISLTGMGDQLIENFKVIWQDNESRILVPGEYTINNTDMVISWKDMGVLQRELLTKLVYNTINLELPSLKTLNKYLRDLIKIITHFNLPISWITPAGMKINLSTVKLNKVRTNLSLVKSGRTKITLNLPTKTLNVKSIVTSFMPNLVHSLDASNIYLLVEALAHDYQSFPLYTIHDCFQRRPNNMGELEDRIKTAFIKMYLEKPYLLQLEEFILKDLSNIKGLEIVDNKIIVEGVDSGLIFPTIPKNFLVKENDSLFETGLRASRYFIS